MRKSKDFSKPPPPPPPPPPRRTSNAPPAHSPKRASNTPPAHSPKRASNTPPPQQPPQQEKKIMRTTYQFLHADDDEKKKAHQGESAPPPPPPPPPPPKPKPPSKTSKSTSNKSKKKPNPPAGPIKSVPTLLTLENSKLAETLQVEGPLHPVISSISIFDIVHNLFVVFAILYYITILFIELVDGKIGNTNTEIILISLSIFAGGVLITLEVILVHLSKLLWTTSDPETSVRRAKKRVKWWLAFSFCMAIFTCSLAVVLVLLPSKRYQAALILAALLSLSVRIAFLLFGAKFYGELLHLYYRSPDIADSTGRPSVVLFDSNHGKNRGTYSVGV